MARRMAVRGLVTRKPMAKGSIETEYEGDRWSLGRGGAQETGRTTNFEHRHVATDVGIRLCAKSRGTYVIGR